MYEFNSTVARLWRIPRTKIFCRDAEKTEYVYEWRLEQESALRVAKGSGMTDEQVVKFVDGCRSLPAGEALRSARSNANEIETILPTSYTRRRSRRVSSETRPEGICD